MIQPTIGRVVHYWDGAGQQEPYAALITFVWNERLINLCAFDANGNPQPRTSIQLVQPEDDIDQLDVRAEWMPYQVKKPTGSESGEKAAGTETV